jgi:hypothetical protein
MKRRAIVGIAAFVLTIALLLPLLFFLSKGAISTNQYLVIVSGVLLFVLWTIPYAILVDPLLRRGIGALFGVTIEWQGPSNSLSWASAEGTGCILGLIIVLLGYLFIILWFMPLAAVVAWILWFRH